MKRLSKIILNNMSFLLLMGLTFSFNGCGSDGGTHTNNSSIQSQTMQNISLSNTRETNMNLNDSSDSSDDNATNAGESTGTNSGFQQVLNDSAVASTSPTAFYGDPMNEEVVVIDIETMRLLKRIPTNGENTYTVDKISDSYKKIYAITRGSNSIEVINTETLENVKTIALKHFPRSCAFNSVLGLTLISGKDKPMSTLIDVEKDEVVASVGKNCKTSPKDYGGGNATGHPFWFTKDKFALIDRADRTIFLYQVKKVNGCWKVSCLDKLYTPTSVHHFIQRGLDDMDGGVDAGDIEYHTFYAVAEGGSPSGGKAPQILEVILDNNKLSISREVTIDCGDEKNLGVHHGTFHPDGVHIYLPSNEGRVHVINYHTMKVETTIKSGKGSGHVKFVPSRNIAVVTNHKDTFITIVDTKHHTHIKDIKVSGESIHGTILQSHTSYLDKDEKYFYAFATDNGVFYKLDLETLEVVDELYTGGTPKQGCFLDL